MASLAIELDDRALSLARAGRLLSSAASAVFDGSAGAAVGTRAWQALRTHPMSTSTRHLGSVLMQKNLTPGLATLVTAELKARLAEHPPLAGERLWMVAPARMEPRGLGALLGMVGDVYVPVAGFLDAAVVTVAALGREHNAIVLEIGLHHAAATAVDTQGGEARRRRTLVAESCGLLDLYQTWLDLVGTSMIKRKRFDPLHDAATEQRLFDTLPELTAEIASRGVATASISKGTERFEVALTRDQFARAAEPVCRRIAELLHQLRPAGASVRLVLGSSIGGLPGVRAALEQFVGCELTLLPDGFAACAASMLELPPPPTEALVRLLRRLPLRELTDLTGSLVRETLGKHRSGARAPSHALFEGRAYSLGAEPLVVGRMPGTSASIVLPEGLAGVSRRHCTLASDGAEMILLDHSAYGTYVNGERVAERVHVHAGDSIRLGEPGVDLSLIAVGEPASET